VSRPCERETRIHIGCRDKVAPAPVVILFHGIKRHDVSRVLCFQVFWLSQYLSSLSLHYPSEMGNLLRKHSKSSHIFDESPDSGDGRTNKVSFGTERKKKRENLLLSKIGMRFSKASNFFENEIVPEAFSFGFWSPLLFREGVDLLSSFKEVFLPEKEGSSLRFWKRFEGGA